MAWEIAVVLDREYGAKELGALVHRMPVWAVDSAERRLVAPLVRKGAGDLWEPEHAFTLFQPASDISSLINCQSVVGTVLDHHPDAALLQFIGISASDGLTEFMRAVDFEPAAGSLFEGLPFRKPLNKFDDVREIVLDASLWKTSDDMYESFFAGVGSAAFHGKNFDALRDSIVTGGINRIEVPYRLVIEHADRIGSRARETADKFFALVRSFEAKGCPIGIQFRER